MPELEFSLLTNVNIAKVFLCHAREFCLSHLHALPASSAVTAEEPGILGSL